MEGYNPNAAVMQFNTGLGLAGRKTRAQSAALLPSLYLFTGLLVKGKEYYSNASRVESLARTRGQVRAATNTIVQLIVPKPAGASPFVGEVVKFRRRRYFPLCLLRACRCLPHIRTPPRLLFGLRHRHPIHQRARPSPSLDGGGSYRPTATTSH